jgi:hypothetical protein
MIVLEANTSPFRHGRSRSTCINTRMRTRDHANENKMLLFEEESDYSCFVDIDSQDETNNNLRVYKENMSMPPICNNHQAQALSPHDNATLAEHYYDDHVDALQLRNWIRHGSRTFPVSAMSSERHVVFTEDETSRHFEAPMDEGTKRITCKSNSLEESKALESNIPEERYRAMQVIAALANVLAIPSDQPTEPSEHYSTNETTPFKAVHTSQYIETKVKKSNCFETDSPNSVMMIGSPKFQRLDSRTLSLPPRKTVTLPRKSSLKCFPLSSSERLSTTTTVNSNTSARSSSSLHSLNTMKRTVSFGTLRTREYNVALSDHPSCSCGPPIQLGWEFREKEPVGVHEYELSRSPRRSPHDMVLNYHVRHYLLLKRAGYSPEDIDNAMKEVDRVKRQRMLTDILLPWESLVQSVNDMITMITGMTTRIDR